MQLEEWRIKKGLSYVDLAKMLKVSVQTIYNWISGRNLPTRHFEEIEELTKNQVPTSSWFRKRTIEAKKQEMIRGGKK